MFYNEPSNKFEELKSYYPRFYFGVLEMMELLKAYGSILDNIAGGIENVYGNCFLSTADSETISRLEAFLKISLDKSRSVEERRRMLKAFFSGFGKSSASTIKEMISGYTGADVDVALEPFDEAGNNRLEIMFERGKEKVIYMADIQFLLEARIPAHIEYRAVLTFIHPVIVEKPLCLSYEINHIQSGVLPEHTKTGLVISSATEAAHDISNVPIMFKFSSDDEGELSGVIHEHTHKGQVISSSSKTLSGSSITSAEIEHIPCGLIFAR